VIQQYQKKARDSKPGKPKKPKTKWQKQVAKLDKYFSEYIRLMGMDPETGLCECVSCGAFRPWNMRKTHAGHFINKSLTKNLWVRWHFKNVNCQCYKCNKELSGNKYEYAEYLKTIYGPDIIVELKIQASKPFNPMIYDMEYHIKLYRDLVKKLKKEKGVS